MTQTAAVKSQLGNGLVVEDWERLTFRVNREAYRSEAVFDAERERIWSTSWLFLGHETEVPEPNDFKVRTLDGVRESVRFPLPRGLGERSPGEREGAASALHATRP